MAPDAVYVYGVSSASGGDMPEVQGIDAAEVRMVTHGNLAAITSTLSRDTLAARDLRAHWRVLERAFERTTVLPVRFGTVMESESDVRDRLLEPNADRLTALLEQMHGLVQLNVKGRYDEDALLREIVSSDRTIARLRDRLRVGATPAEQIRLGQLVESAVAGHRELDSELALQALETSAQASRAQEVAHPAAFDLAFLVERDAEPAFSGAVHELRERFGSRIELRYVGPLPPLHFVEADLLGTGGGAWA